MRHLLAALGLAASFGPAWAESLDSIQQGYALEAKAQVASFAGFSAERGRRAFLGANAKGVSCSSCHTEDPAAEGRHAATGKRIAPLAPARNPERFTRADKVEKWFRRNCNDVLGRECTVTEKGDVLAWLTTLK